MFSGGLIAQLIGLVTIPIVTRLYAPELYGEYSIYIQLIVAISIALSLRYEHLLLLSSSHTMAVNNLKNILLIALVGVLVIPIIIWGNIDNIEQYYEVTLDSNVVLILVVSGFITCLSYGLELNLQKKEVFFKSTLGDVLLRSTSFLFAVTFAYTSFKEYGLLLALMSGLISKAVYLMWVSNFDICKGGFSFNFIELKKLSKRAFALVFSHFMLVFTQLLPLQYISTNFGKNTLGQFSLTLITLSLVISIGSEPIGKIYFQRMVNTKSREEKLELWTKTIKLAILISLPIFTLIYLTSSWGYIFFFGNEWTQSGDLAKILLFGFYFAFISRPMESTSLVLNIWWYSPLWHTFRVCSMYLLFNYLQEKNIPIEESLKYFVSLLIVTYLIDIFVQRGFLKRL